MLTSKTDDEAVLKSPLFPAIRNYLLETDTEQRQLFVFAPYIKTSVISRLLEGVNAKVTIVTSWNTQDLLTGSSELSLYPFCKRNGFALYVNNNIHLKAYSGGFDDMIVATANISERGLLQNGHLECAVYVPKLESSDRMYFSQIIRNARHINDIIFRELMNWYKEQDKIRLPDINTFDEIVRPKASDDFLISALPMTRSIEILEQAYVRINRGLQASDDNEITQCVFHDLTNYNIPIGLTRAEFRKRLATAFFSHPFIRRIDEIIDPEAYFGMIKEWVQRNCMDVPIPSRRELTGNVQVLLEWFVSLGAGRYIVDIPYSHSQRIYRQRQRSM